MSNNYKYYGNYDKNIKSIRGGGVITQSNPPNRITTTNTIKNTWDNMITPTTPLFKTVYYSDKNLTNGYLNDDNYVLENKSISDYYFPSQKFDKVINLKKNKSKNKLNEQEIYLNNINPIKFPAPLINSKSTKINNSDKSDKINKSDKQDKTDKINKSDKSDKQDKSDKSDKQDKSDKSDNSDDYIDYITNNSIYDGKYIYMLENKPIEIPKGSKNKITHLPYLYKSTNINLPNSIIEYDKINDIDDIDNIDNIQETFNTNNNLFNEIPNTFLLIIFSVLLIMYFTIYKKY